MSITIDTGPRPTVVIDQPGLKVEGEVALWGREVPPSDEPYTRTYPPRVHRAFRDGAIYNFEFRNGVEVRGVRGEPQAVSLPEPEPERRGIQLEPGAKLKPGDLVDVYVAPPDGEPIFGFADPRNLTVERSEEDFDSRYVHFVGCPYRVKVELWKDRADDGYEVRMVEPAGEKVGDWSTLQDGDVVNILQYFPHVEVDRFHREVSVYDADEDGVSFDTEAGASSAALKEDGDEIYLVHRPKRRLPTERGSWVMVTECEVSDSALRRICTPFPAFKSDYWWVAEVTPGDWDYIIKPEEIIDWYEIEFTSKEEA